MNVIINMNTNQVNFSLAREAATHTALHYMAVYTFNSPARSLNALTNYPVVWESIK